MINYYYIQNDEHVGPVTREELIALRQRGEITDQTLIIEEGADTYASFQDRFGADSPPAPKASPFLSGAQVCMNRMRGINKDGIVSKIIDKFFNGSFNVGRVIAAIAILLCSLVFLFGVKLLLFGKGMEIPEFRKGDSSLSYHERSMRDAKPDLSYLEEIENDKRLKACEDMVVSTIRENIKPDKYDDYIDGLIEYLDDADDYYKSLELTSDKKRFWASEIRSYNTEFILNQRSEESLDKEARASGMSLIVSSVMAFAIALLIPLLIQIERNTRQLRS